MWHTCKVFAYNYFLLFSYRTRRNNNNAICAIDTCDKSGAHSGNQIVRDLGAKLLLWQKSSMHIWITFETCRYIIIYF